MLLILLLLFLLFLLLLFLLLWDGRISDWFSMSAGVRQGGVPSADQFSLYTDSDKLVSILQCSRIGSYILKKFASALLYADDLAVLEPSIEVLQKMLNLCHYS